MKLLILVLVAVLVTISLVAQKLPIDSTAILNWPTLGENPNISGDGKYFLYTIDNFPVGNSTLTVEPVDKSWEQSFTNVKNGFFSEDSKTMIFLKKDTLFFFSLSNKALSAVPNVSSYKLSQKGQVNYIAYHKRDPKSTLILRNVATMNELSFDSVKDYAFNKSGTVLLLKRLSNVSGSMGECLQWLKIGSDELLTIWTDSLLSSNSSAIKAYCFDNEGKQLAFIVNNKARSDSANSIWYYRDGMAHSVEKVNAHSPGMDSGMAVSPFFMHFSSNGSWIHFRLKPTIVGNENTAEGAPSIWTYRDTILKSINLQGRLADLKLCPAVVGVQTNITLSLGGQNDNVLTESGNYVVIKTNYYGPSADPMWSLKMPNTYYLFSLKTKSRKFLMLTSNSNVICQFDPDGKYLVYFDKKEANFYSYNLETNTIANISKDINCSIIKMDKYPWGPVSWDPKAHSLLIYDQYDIWKVDLNGRLAPVNLTMRYGRIHRIVMRLIQDQSGDSRAISKGDSLIAVGFSPYTKENGFFEIALHPEHLPLKLLFGPFDIYTAPGQTQTMLLFYHQFIPIKASGQDLWVVRKMTTMDAPNYFLTRDFEHILSLTDLHPEAKYNWISAELIHFRQLDDIPTQGILYKPVDFDPQKKYPVIINYYMKFSDRLFQFPQPEFMEQEINIPYFVSRGYLVFTPDIYYRLGHPGQSAYNSVVAAVRHLCQKPWINANKIGIEGHSFGGFETYYLISHTHLFAAAMAGAGTTDLVSEYNSLTISGNPQQAMAESGQYNIGSTLWQQPELYLENSPIFEANHVSAPLLIMHNRDDTNVNWEQGIGFFLALRRLGKPVWLLQYKDGGHVIRKPREAEDFTRRATQFFDYYLKNQPLPDWMFN